MLAISHPTTVTAQITHGKQAIIAKMREQTLSGCALSIRMAAIPKVSNVKKPV
jgi:hypothetical protein